MWLGNHTIQSLGRGSTTIVAHGVTTVKASSGKSDWGVRGVPGASQMFIWLCDSFSVTANKAVAAQEAGDQQIFIMPLSLFSSDTRWYNVSRFHSITARRSLFVSLSKCNTFLTFKAENIIFTVSLNFTYLLRCTPNCRHSCKSVCCICFFSYELFQI